MHGSYELLEEAGECVVDTRKSHGLVKSLQVALGRLARPWFPGSASAGRKGTSTHAPPSVVEEGAYPEYRI